MSDELPSGLKAKDLLLLTRRVEEEIDSLKKTVSQINSQISELSKALKDNLGKVNVKLENLSENIEGLKEHETNVINQILQQLDKKSEKWREELAGLIRKESSSLKEAVSVELLNMHSILTDIFSKKLKSLLQSLIR